MLKKILLGLVALIVAAVVVGGGFAYVKASAFDASVAKVYDVPLPNVTRSSDEAVLARGKHLAESLGGCYACHGSNLAGGKLESMGPLGKMQPPNITAGKGSKGAPYSDAELARLVKHGLRRDGTSVRFMPSQDFAWWPDDDVAALVSYLRTVPPVDGDVGLMEIGFLGKVLDQLDKIPLDIARRIDHQNLPKAPSPAPTREYGAYVARLCTGCHGAGLAGGRIPGAPSELPVPLNLTPHETGLAGWSFEDFARVLREGVRKNGKKLDPFMDIVATKNLDDTEMKALWAYLQSLPPRPLGGR